MKKYILLLLVTTLGFTGGYAQRIDTISVHSNKMDIDSKCVVLLPASYDTAAVKTKFPVLYLLHGYTGDYRGWIDVLKKNLPQMVSDYNMIVVCPDAKNSWYWDSPIDPKSQYETYITKELVHYVDSHYRTITSPKGRAISGLSMGGHGGLFLGFRHTDLYGACGGMSGGVDIRPFPKNWEMEKVLGSYKSNPKRWDDHSVMTQLDKIKGKNLKIIFDDGTEDFFYPVNLKLHEKMVEMKIPHEFISRPGDHSVPYWHNAIDDQLIFFAKFFNTYNDN